jgi:hypothetical protein
MREPGTDHRAGDRAAAHYADTVSLLDGLIAWAERLRAGCRRSQRRYTITRHTALSRFVADARLDIDNNIAETAMHCVALGRKDRLFAGSDGGGDRAAATYNIMQTAKRPRSTT